MDIALTPQEVEQTIKAYLPQVVHLSLATCADNKPWVCEVHFAADEDLNLYFCSMQDTRHSQEIAGNPQVAGNIVTQHFLGQSVRGVYFEGIAELVGSVDENQPAYKTYTARYGARPDILKSYADQEPMGRRLYKITVTDYYLFDSYKSKPSQKYHLPRPKA